MEKESRKYFFAWAGLSVFVWSYIEYKNYNFPVFIRNLKESVITPSVYSESNEGKIVSVSGPISTQSSSDLQDPLFKLNQKALKIKRNVEMMQWVQNPDSSMILKWTSSPIDSSKFNKEFENPKWKLNNAVFVSNSDLKINEYNISREILNSVNDWQQVICEYKENDFKQVLFEGKLVLYPNKISIKKQGKSKFLMNNYEKKFKKPKLGNYRVSHEYVPNETVYSVIGLQSKEWIRPYKGLLLSKKGVHSAETIIDDYSHQWHTGLWIGRVLCFLSTSLALIFGLSSYPN